MKKIIYHSEKIKFNKDYTDYEVIETKGVHVELFNARHFANKQDYDVLIVECDKQGNANEDIEIIINTRKKDK